MKKISYLFITLCLVIVFFTSSCSFKTDDLEGAKIYTTVYPINYLTQYLYSDYGTISSIYPVVYDIETYSLTKKQIKEYAKGDLFIYDGLTEEKEIAKNLINKNSNLLIIDVSSGLTLENNPIELWLSPNNYLMLAKNIKNNLQEYLTSKYIIDDIENNYNEFEEKISLMDASLYSIGKDAEERDKNIIVVSNSAFKYLEKYGFEVIALDDENNLKENKLNAIKTNFDNGKYKHILLADIDKENEIVKDLVDNYEAKTILVDTLTTSLTSDYFEIMTSYIENIKTIVS